jgi:hypothetical protein
MSYYVAFPAHLVAELLAFLPDDERPIYAERFEPIVGDLVWVRADAENAIAAAIAQSQDPRAEVCGQSPERVRALTDVLVAMEHESLVTLTQECLEQAATSALQEHLHIMNENASGFTEGSRNGS